MALSLKRACSSLPFPSDCPSLKRCRKNSTLKNNNNLNNSNILLAHSEFYGVSSSDDNDDENDDDDDADSESDYKNNFRENPISRRKSMTSNRRRSSTKSAAETPLNIALSRAVALYSDDEDEDEDDADKAENKHQSRKSHDDGRNSFPETVTSAIADGHISYQKSHNGRGSPSRDNHKDASNLSTSSVRSIRSSLPDSDRAARARCLEYLVGAIDEAWARYCDATSYAEDENYGYNKSANTPGSTAISDNDEDSDASLAETEITDYGDLDYNIVDSKCVADVKQEQENHQSSLQNLKDRLMNAKYYLQDYVDSDNYEDCAAFWKRWDMVKYCTIELVEDEDEDDIVENTIDELENGRFQIVS